MEKKPLRVSLLGYGAIGQDIMRLIAERVPNEIVVVGALVRHPTHTRPSGPAIVATLPALLAEQPQVIVEVAGHEGLREHGCAVLQAGIDLILVSVGALADPHVLHALLESADIKHAHIIVASGAIGGLDALSAASFGRLTSIVYTMRKPPSTLLAPEEAAHITYASEIFRASVRQAIQQYPEFLNVAVAVALAGNDFDLTEVRVVADPTVEHSLHAVQVEGDFGRFRFEIENKPIDGVGRGAQLVAMSIVRELLLRRTPFIVG